MKESRFEPAQASPIKRQRWTTARIKNRLSTFVPQPTKARLKTLYWSLRALIDPRTAKDDQVPPKSLAHLAGGGDFETIGQEYKRYFIELGGLRPDDRVLDVGCGVGRMAVALAGYLSPAGEYRGFDLGAGGIHWCQTHITPRFPNFQFWHSDIYNKAYNPRGRVKSQEFEFPYANAYFDFAFLTSVFTHMLLPDVEHYLGELARVLRPGGTCLATFFLLDETALDLIARSQGRLDFSTAVEGGLTINKRTPEAAIAFQEGLVRSLFDKSRLEIQEPIHWGGWSGRGKSLSSQDIVIARKR